MSERAPNHTLNIIMDGVGFIDKLWKSFSIIDWYEDFEMSRMKLVVRSVVSGGTIWCSLRMVDFKSSQEISLQVRPDLQ